MPRIPFSPPPSPSPLRATSISRIPEATVPPSGFFEEFAAAAPPMTGAEYLTLDLLGLIWTELGRAIGEEARKGGAGLQAYLQGLNPAWQIVGRVCFHLAELKDDRETPFAFLATTWIYNDQEERPQ